jgi:hypothetical protein
MIFRKQITYYEALFDSHDSVYGIHDLNEHEKCFGPFLMWKSVSFFPVVYFVSENFIIQGINIKIFVKER